MSSPTSTRPKTRPRGAAPKPQWLAPDLAPTDPESALRLLVEKLSANLAWNGADPVAGDWVLTFLEDVIVDASHPARRAMGFPARVGRPAGRISPAVMERNRAVCWYVYLAVQLGHSKTQSLLLAAKEFGFRGDEANRLRSVQRIVNQVRHKPGPKAIAFAARTIVARSGHSPPPSHGKK